MPKRGSWKSLLTSIDWPQIRARLRLSAREAEVTRHIVEGKKLSGIAEELNLGLGTVKTYCNRIHAKLGVTDQRELMLAVLEAARRPNSDR